LYQSGAILYNFFVAEILNKSEGARAAEIIKAGGVVAVRTETVWGLAALKESAEKVFHAKQRPVDKNLVFQCPNIKEAQKHFYLSDLAKKLFKKYKGKITVALDPDTALRIPKDRVIKKLLTACAVPLVVTSANISGEPPCKDWREIDEKLGTRIDAIIKSGRSKIGKPSTIVAVHNKHIEFVRIGAISKAQIEKDFKNWLAPKDNPR
jgi:L-threonylcarbamoyladenylate synthase